MCQHHEPAHLPSMGCKVGGKHPSSSISSPTPAAVRKKAFRLLLGPSRRTDAYSMSGMTVRPWFESQERQWLPLRSVRAAASVLGVLFSDTVI